jgi:hypothetical protein
LIYTLSFRVTQGIVRENGREKLIINPVLESSELNKEEGYVFA